MKVLQTIKYYEPSKGGMETFAKNLVNGLLKHYPSVTIEVVCNTHTKTKKNSNEDFGRLKIFRKSSRILFRSQPLTLFYQGIGKKINDCDVIHHHYPYPTMELSILFFKGILKKKKFVVTWHANIENSRWAWIKKIYNPMINSLLDVASDIIVTSPQLYEHSRILNRYKDKVKIIPLSFEAHNHEIFSKKLQGKPKILFVGKFRKYKGLKNLINAVVNLDVSVDIVGNGELEQELHNLIETTKQTEKIKLHTQVDDQKLKSFYQNSDIFVLPSINEAEAFAIVQLEAMSYGLPVINTKLKSGVPYVSLDKVTGLTVEPNNTKQLTEAIVKIISSPELYAQFSKNAVSRAREFTNDKMVERYYNIYME